MTAFVALLRAVNVGGRKLVMTDLKRIAEEAGFERARTFIASGNLIFASDRGERDVAGELEERLRNHMGADVPVFVRTRGEMEKISAANPFSDEAGSTVAAIFLNASPPADLIEKARGVADERMALGTREIYVHYPSGMAATKLRFPSQIVGTARNMNTVAKLAELAKEVE
ncbi:DUF1697 domain-containing protein [Sphingomonas daechungensis]|uniref:DUF1697 domain-containing protein n=1 Tax=Sphingomonas daechungensis TaxID=1176646 RepID=UPI003783F214